MRTLSALLGYVVSAALLMGVLWGGVFWLVRPDPSLTQGAKAAPIPPRIADSIERKKLPDSIETPAAVKAVVHEPMQEANAALTRPTPSFKIRELSPLPTEKRKRKSKEERAATASLDTAPDTRLAPRSVATGRTDFPY
jgi:hypothetical protein